MKNFPTFSTISKNNDRLTQNQNRKYFLIKQPKDMYLSISATHTHTRQIICNFISLFHHLANSHIRWNTHAKYIFNAYYYILKNNERNWSTCFYLNYFTKLKWNNFYSTAKFLLPNFIWFMFRVCATYKPDTVLLLSFKLQKAFETLKS